MTFIAHGGAAAAEAARRIREEEEELTPYSQADLAEDWEFKILRSALGGFSKPEYLQKVLAEEARAGWQLVEKFDNNRLRLKRQVKARDMDKMLEFDPYRTYAGMSQNTLAFWIVGAILAMVAGVILFALTQ